MNTLWRAHTRARTHGHPSRPILTALAALAVAATAALALTMAAAAPAHAHDELVGTSVTAGADSGAAEAIVLSFNNEVLEVGTEIVVTGPDGSDATDGLPTVAGRDVTQALASPLNAGSYAMVWRVVSSDGHPIQGEFSLEISETGAGTLSEVAGDEVDPAHEDDADHTHEDGTEHGDAEHSDAEHDHGDETEVTTLGDMGDTSGAAQPWWLWALIAVGVLGVAASVITSAVVGSKRRREAMSGAQGAGESGADEVKTGADSADTHNADENGADR